MDSLVSGFVLPFRTISVLDINPVAESTSVSAALSVAPEVRQLLASILDFYSNKCST